MNMAMIRKINTVKSHGMLSLDNAIVLLTHVIITPSLRFIADFIKILEVSTFPVCLYGSRAKCALPQYKHIGKLLTSRIFINDQQ